MAKKDFKKELTKRRDDSPLRWIANVHHTTTHNERIRWLLYENRHMYGELITAKLFKGIAELKYYIVELMKDQKEMKVIMKDLREILEKNDSQNN